MKQGFGRFGHANFGVTHGGRWIPVHGSEIALAVEQRQTHGKVLRHADHRIVNRLVTMRMILTHDIAHDAGGFSVGLVVGVALFVHAKEDAPVNRLQPVTNVGERARDDDAHGVIEIRAPHLLFDGYRSNVGCGRFGRWNFGVSHTCSGAPVWRSGDEVARNSKNATYRVTLPPECTSYCGSRQTLRAKIRANPGPRNCLNLPLGNLPGTPAITPGHPGIERCRMRRGTSSSQSGR